jgi:hypothetical protein
MSNLDRYKHTNPSSRRAGAWVVLVLLLSTLACQVSSGVLGGATPTPIPTSTPYPTYTPYPTWTPAPSATPRPTFTPSPMESVAASPEELFFEDFEGSFSCFEFFDDGMASGKIEDGAYHIRLDQVNLEYRTWCTPDTFDNFVLEVDVTPVQEVYEYYYGLVFRTTDQEFYLYFVDNLGGVCLAYSKMDDRINLTNSVRAPGDCWVYPPVLPSSSRPVALKVVAEGQRLEIYLNGTLAAVAMDQTIQSGWVGFVVGSFAESGVELAFDNLRISEPLGPGE